MLIVSKNQMPYGNTPGEVIFWLRKKRNIKQIELSKELMISPARLSRIENGKCELTPDECVRAANFFNLPCDYILLNVKEK